MEELKAAWETLKKLINSCDKGGVNGTRVQELKDEAEKVQAEIEKLED